MGANAFPPSSTTLASLPLACKSMLLEIIWYITHSTVWLIYATTPLDQTIAERVLPAILSACYLPVIVLSIGEYRRLRRGATISKSYQEAYRAMTFNPAITTVMGGLAITYSIALLLHHHHPRQTWEFAAAIAFFSAMIAISWIIGISGRRLAKEAQ